MDPEKALAPSASAERSVASPAGGSDYSPAWDPPIVPRRAVSEPNDERVRLALRMVVYLDQVGPPNDGGTVAPEATQEGLASALSATQGAVSKVLRRLEAANVVDRESRHVRGRDRRVQVYFLTASGAELAREIEERFGLARRGPPPPRAAPTSMRFDGTALAHPQS